MKGCVGSTSISLQAACDLFFLYLKRLVLVDDETDFDGCKARMVALGEEFAGRTQACRNRIAQMASRFVRDGSTVLTHGFSRVVCGVLIAAAKTASFRVIVTETRPGGDFVPVAECLRKKDIPVTVILDSAVAAVMERVDMVLVGAQGIVENGGLINKIGTLHVAMAAQAFNKPFYVAAESYKFTRLYPLGQRDLPLSPKENESWAPIIRKGQVEDPTSLQSLGVQFINPPSDFTPASYITLLFSDRGVLTPQAVSEELIRLFANEK
mmetsp:Transcript_16185/g.32819  ORF Transcript_16185/g.32819 Transcript_16185/m.32819 type:complete len:267 (-) Transcript_16185:363-1163(-)